jgi:hypothetical protein
MGYGLDSIPSTTKQDVLPQHYFGTGSNIIQGMTDH